ncbi:hypothetical protein [Paenibacillus whitsoniae]|uniref:Uncharacterized protein n=1 Tax=Paenibacillus whitsoniae TaxID=2496558 RepID=A0A430JDC1_9BACL|nr:hypothetical protein [Paenibacillus whitsoniae]RTE09009.1 hypothetical protein EJQ19_14685 [Paenibacillus whitsoniae]
MELLTQLKAPKRPPSAMSRQAANYAQSVQWAAENGITSSVSADEFAPAAKMLCVLMHTFSPDKHGFNTPSRLRVKGLLLFFDMDKRRVASAF